MIDEVQLENNLHLLIDGVDECESDDVSELLQHLVQILQLHRLSDKRIKLTILAISRRSELTSASIPQCLYLGKP